MIDLDEIRRALATRTQLDVSRLYANAQTWLAALILEVERLRELSAQLQVEQDVAIAEVERLRAFISSGALGVQVAEQIDKLVAERDAALAENERLRTATDAIHTETLAKWSTAETERAIVLLEGAADLEYVCPDIYPKDLA